MQFEVGNSPVKIGDSKRKEEEKKIEADKEFLPLLQLKKIDKVVNDKDKQVINLYENQSKKISICVDKDKKTEFELKITFNEDKKINSDVFIDIFSNTNSPLAKPTLSGSALHRFKMKIWGNVLPPWMKIAFEKFKMAKGVSEGQEPLFSFAKSCLEFGGNNSRPDNNVSGQWCAAFVSWCVNETKYKVGEKGNQRVNSQQFIRLAEEGKVYKIIDKPVVGCIVVMSNYKKDTQKPDGSGHITFLYAIDGNNLVCLGGNQGDRLKFSNYKRNGVNFNFSKNGSIYQQKFNCFLMPIDYPEALYNYNIPKLTADEANKKHFLNLETEENEQTF